MLDQFAANWWAWVIFGFLLGILEIIVPGFIFLGFAIGAVATGALVGAGIAPAGVTALLMTFAIISACYLSLSSVASSVFAFVARFY